jgi:hypothetical protein
MKKSAFVAIPMFFAFLVFLAGGDAFARGFGGGGGGAYGGGGAMNRSPSMSSHSGSRSSVSQSTPKPSTKVSSRPSGPSSPGKQALPATGKLPSSEAAKLEGRPGGAGASRPSESQVQHFLNLPDQRGSGLSDLGKVGIGAAAGALGYAGAQQLLGSERHGAGDRSRIGDRPSIGDRPGAGDRPSTLPSRANADRIRDNVQNRHDDVFTPKWWKNHPHMAHAYWDNFGKHQYGWNHWWRPATWTALGAWVAGASWNSPAYYDYETGVYYEDDQVYEAGKPVATTDQYYQQASDIAAKAPEAPQQDAEWLPLGVFALSRGDATDSNMLLQLAVNKDGVIAGTYYNTTTDTGRPVKGMVDKQTQRAAWTFADGKNTDIIMETGIANLTQDQTEALVHFGKDTTQKWLMVRLKQPQEDTQPGTKS